MKGGRGSKKTTKARITWNLLGGKADGEKGTELRNSSQVERLRLVKDRMWRV